MTPTYTTPMSVTEVLCLKIYLSNTVLMTLTVKVMADTVLAYSIFLYDALNF